MLRAFEHAVLVGVTAAGNPCIGKGGAHAGPVFYEEGAVAGELPDAVEFDDATELAVGGGVGVGAGADGEERAVVAGEDGGVALGGALYDFPIAEIATTAEGDGAGADAPEREGEAEEAVAGVMAEGRPGAGRLRQGRDVGRTHGAGREPQDYGVTGGVKTWDAPRASLRSRVVSR